MPQSSEVEQKVIKCRVRESNWGYNDFEVSDWMEFTPEEFSEASDAIRPSNYWLEVWEEPTSTVFQLDKEALLKLVAEQRAKEEKAEKSALAKKLRQYEKLKKELGLD